MDGGGRAASGTGGRGQRLEQLPRTAADSNAGSTTAGEVGGRVTPGAVTELPRKLG